ncbi:MAG TPA: hypothetical protein VK050_06480 [Flavobacteriaceae bacterium]|nr:hypothetical protein [Flavobacteriaceae bacterium]
MRKNKINDLRQLVSHIQTLVQEIKTTDVVVDESQLNRNLDKIRVQDNYILIGVIPEYNSSGSLDNVNWNSVNAMIVLHKTDSSDNTHDQFLDMMNNTQNIAIDVMNSLITLATSGDCNFISKIKPGSFSMDPVWLRSGCNGWMITYINDEY